MPGEAQASLRDGSGGGSGLHGHAFPDCRIGSLIFLIYRYIDAVKEPSRDPGHGHRDVDGKGHRVSGGACVLLSKPNMFLLSLATRLLIFLSLLSHLVCHAFIPVGPQHPARPCWSPGQRGSSVTPIPSLFKFLAFCSSWIFCINVDVLKCCIKLFVNLDCCELAPGRMWGSPQPVVGVSSQAEVHECSHRQRCCGRHSE